MNVEQHAEAILRALDIPLVNAPAILAAVEAAMVAGAEAMREACEQRLKLESDGRSEQAKAAREAKSKLQARDFESMAIALGQGRSSIIFIDPAAIVKGMGNG